MSLQHLAHHIAAKGRHGDDTLVHVSKDELAGLQALAKKHGTSLTVNPQTGLPEAFGLRNLLPMAAGAALTVAGVPAPLAIGLVGGGTYLATGSLQQGVMAGMGAWGGAGLAGGVMAAGAQQAAGEELAKQAAEDQFKQQALDEAAKQQLTQQTTINTLGQNAITPQAIENVAAKQAAFNAQIPENLTPEFMSPIPAGSQIPVSTYAATATPAQIAAQNANLSGTELFSKGVSSLGTEVGRNAAYAGMGGGWGLTKYGLAAAAPAIAESMQPKPYEQPNIQGDSDMGPRYMFNSGYSNDIPGRTGPASYQRMTPEEAKKYYGFAEGGEVQYPYGESVVRMNDGGSTDQHKALISALENSGFGAANKVAQNATFLNAPSPQLEAIFNRQNAGEDAGQQYSYDSENEQYVRRMADGGAAVDGGIAGIGMGGASDYTGYGPSSSQGQVTPGYEATGYAPASYGLDYSGYATPVSRGVVAPRAVSAAPKVTDNTGIKGFRYDPATRTFVGKATDANYIGGGEYGKSVAELQAELDAERAKNQSNQATTTDTWVAKGGLAPDFKRMAAGGIADLGSYSDGGRLLKGPGDGMSDNIPAQIGQKQPARLADGEFVVPADVVSHLGNGSTDAGAKQLYKMMDNIRKARTGRKAQGKQINPRKYLPA